MENKENRKRGSKLECFKQKVNMKKYFKKKKEAIKVCEERNKGKGFVWYKVFKMPKGTKRHGEFAVCSEMEYLNTY